MKFVRLLCILLLGLWGCLTEPDCFDTSTNLVTFAFYDADDELVEVEIDSLTISGWKESSSPRIPSLAPFHFRLTRPKHRLQLLSILER
ncbi:MAG: hypothetical protein HWD62_15115 [Cyclobacteriaceae bacterium]|nr:MAG: hypothetical protein HWD62_15115 [Cyclobacteriaceae bacterium]